MKETYEQHALARKVLAVAVIKYDGDKLFDWAVYIDAVPGQNHNNEYMKVAEEGAKQNERIAGLLFPHIDIKRYRR